MLDTIRFGPSGNSPHFYEAGFSSSLQAPKWLAEKGVTAFELSCGKGYIFGEEFARKMGEQAKEFGILLSIHAPYYINLANTDEEMIQKSFNHILRGLELLDFMHGQDLIIHVASCGKQPRESALETTKTNLKRVVDLVKQSGFGHLSICLETMGKFPQIGNENEIIELCMLDPIFKPCFDFGHINARTGGGLKEKQDFQKIFDLSLEKLGIATTKNCHIHFSKIEFNLKGEVRHLNFDDTVYGPQFEPLMQVLAENELTPTVICESASAMLEDSLSMKAAYEEAISKKY